jgi:CheY-like chemotaxis protein
VLLVDDSAVNLALGEKILQQLGHQVVTADGGRPALRAARKEPFDVVLLDLRMPDIDGEAVARELRKERGRGQRPVIIGLSADARRRTVEAATEAGLDVFVPKPAGAEQLDIVLREAAARLGRPVNGGGLAKRSTESPVVDEAVWSDHVRRIGDDRVVALAELFRETSAATLEELARAKESGDYDQVAKLAHRLSGSALSVGFGRLGRAASLLEERGRQGDADLAEAYDAVAEAHAATLATLGEPPT